MERLKTLLLTLFALLMLTVGTLYFKNEIAAPDVVSASSASAESFQPQVSVAAIPQATQTAARKVPSDDDYVEEKPDTARSGASSSSAPTAKKAGQSKGEATADLRYSVITPGETLVFTLKNARPDEVKTTSGFDFPVRFVQVDDETAVGLLPLSYFVQPGSYSVTLKGGGLPQEGVTFPVEVAFKQFDVQQLTVKEEVANSTIFNDEASKEYRQKIWPMKDVFDAAQYFDGPLQNPLKVPQNITTQFGMVRYVNGKPNPRHDGVDFSAGTGTPIYAAQNGRVIFSDFVKLTGNTIIIEHGLGLKTWYQHLDTLNVKPDDRVKTGDLIGTVGATGFVTGPHLHFSASVNNVYVNPFTLIESPLLAASSDGE